MCSNFSATTAGAVINRRYFEEIFCIFIVWSNDLSTLNVFGYFVIESKILWTWLKVANIYFIWHLQHSEIQYLISSIHPSVIHFLCNCFRVKKRKKEKNRIQLQFDFSFRFSSLCVIKRSHFCIRFAMAIIWLNPCHQLNYYIPKHLCSSILLHFWHSNYLCINH